MVLKEVIETKRITVTLGDSLSIAPAAKGGKKHPCTSLSIFLWQYRKELQETHQENAALSPLPLMCVSFSHSVYGKRGVTPKADGADSNILQSQCKWA